MELKEVNSLVELFFEKYKEKKESTLSLFKSSKKKIKLPELISSEIEDAYDQVELFGFSLCHPFRLFREWQGQESVSIKDWNKYYKADIMADASAALGIIGRSGLG